MFSKTVKFEYPLKQVNQPVVTRLVKDFDVAPNILSANIDPHRGGWLVVELLGEEESVGKAVAWTIAQGVTVTEGAA